MKQAATNLAFGALVVWASGVWLTLNPLWLWVDIEGRGTFWMASLCVGAIRALLARPAKK